MDHLIRGAQPPPSDGPPVYDVVAPVKGEVCEYTILSEYAVGVETHWLAAVGSEKARCVRCPRLEEECKLCGAARPVWLAFVAVYDHLKHSRVILRLGRESMGRLAKAVAPAKTLRGGRWKCYRAGKSPTSPIDFERSQHSALVPCPNAPDVKPTLCMVLKCKSIPEYTYSAKELREGEGEVAT